MGVAKQSAVVGVTEHGNSAVLVTVASDSSILDRRKIDLTTDLPTHPYHHQGSWAVGRYKDSPWSKDISLPDAIALVERVAEGRLGLVKRPGHASVLRALAGEQEADAWRRRPAASC